MPRAPDDRLIVADIGLCMFATVRSSLCGTLGPSRAEKTTCVADVLRLCSVLVRLLQLVN